MNTEGRSSSPGADGILARDDNGATLADDGVGGVIDDISRVETSPRVGHARARPEPTPGSNPARPEVSGVPPRVDAPSVAVDFEDVPPPPRSIWGFALLLGAGVTIGVFLFLGYLQPSLTSGERIVVPQVLRLKELESSKKDKKNETQKQEKKEKPKRRRRPKPKTKTQSARAKPKVSRRPMKVASLLTPMGLGGGDVGGVVIPKLSLGGEQFEEMSSTGDAERQEFIRGRQLMTQREKFRERGQGGGGGDFAGMAGGSPAQPLHKARPKYPRKAQSKSIDGWVICDVVVSATGTVDDIEIVEAEPEGYFEEAIRDALQLWSYQPAKDPQGNPIESVDRVQWVFKFNQ